MTKYKTLFDRTKQKWCEIRNKELRYSDVPILQLYNTDFPYTTLHRFVKEYIAIHCEVKYLEMNIKTSTSPTVWKPISSYTKEQLDLIKERLKEGDDWRVIHRKYFIERSPRGIKELIVRIQKKEKGS